MASIFTHTDTLSIAKRLIKAGLDRKIAEEQAEILELKFEEFRESYQNDIDKKDLVNKGHLDLRIEEVRFEIEIVRKEIVQSQNKVILWVAGLLLAQAGLITTITKLF